MTHEEQEEMRGAEVVRVEEDTEHDLDVDELVGQSDLQADDIERSEEAAREAVRGRPLITLVEFQRDLVTATARFIAGMVCRQGGKTFGSTLRVNRKVLETPHDYYILSRSERQSGNAVSQTAVHARAIEKALAAKGKRLGQRVRCSSQKLRYHRRDGSAFDYRRLRIQYPNGGRVIGLPATPDTTVGISGSVYFDEYAVQRYQREIFGRLLPVVSRKPHYEMLMTSTPRGRQGKWYEIMTSAEYAQMFHRIVVNIYEAIRQGVVMYDYAGQPVVDAEGIERLRLMLRDEDMWAEEYLVQFILDVLVLLSHELIGQCEELHTPDGAMYEPLVFDVPKDFDPRTMNLAERAGAQLGSGELFLGYDIARHRHLAVIWLDEKIGERLWMRALVTMQDVDFEVQEAILWQFLRLPRMRKAAIDATGLGERTAERAVMRFGDRVVPVNFSRTLEARNGTKHPAKALLARTILERHQARLDAYPVMDLIRDDFTKVKRKRGGNPDAFTYFADDDATGHADIFTAKALSDVVAQELIEYGGRVTGMRVGVANAFDEGPESSGRRMAMRAEEQAAREDAVAGGRAMDAGWEGVSGGAW